MPVDFTPDAPAASQGINFIPDSEHPPVKLPDGNIATVRSIGVGDERGEWVIPTIVNGQPVSNESAISLWKSGKNKALGGPFSNVDDANNFAQQFHESEARRLGIAPDSGISFTPDKETTFTRNTITGPNGDTQLNELTPEAIATARGKPPKLELQARMERARQDAGTAESQAKALGFGERVVEPLTPEGLLNQPNRVSAALGAKVEPSPFKAGVPVINLPEATEVRPGVVAGTAAGIYNTVAKTLSGLTTPESIVTMPAAAHSAVVRAIFAGQMAKDIPAEAQNAINKFNDPNATIAEKTEAVATPTVSALMATGLTFPEATQKAAQLISGKLSKQPAKPTEASIPEPAVAPEQPKPLSEQPKQTESPISKPVTQPEQAQTPKMAPVKFLGMQKGAPGKPDFEVYNLTEAIPGKGAGSTIGRPELEQMGYQVPEGEAPKAKTILPGQETEQQSTPVSGQGQSAPARELVGMGGAVRSEFEDVPSEGREVYGIAQRIRQVRADAGEGPDVKPGQGISAPDSVERGRELVDAGGNAEDALTKFEQSKRFNSDDMAMVRAKGEDLYQQARQVERKSGTDSDEYRAARKVADDWDTRTKSMQTEWHKSGMAQQGATDIDTGSFTGLSREFKSQTGKEFNPKQETNAKKLAAVVTDAATKAAKAQDAIKEAIGAAKRDVQQRIAGNTKPPAEPLDAEARALQAIHERHQEMGVAAAKADVKQRVAENTRNIEEARDAAAQKVLKSAQDVANKQAKRVADAENKARVAQAARDKRVSQIELSRERKALEAAQKRVRQAAAQAAKTAREALANPEKKVWDKATEYFEKGETDFNDIRNKVATDLGISTKKVTELLARDKRVKSLADDLWLKQQRLRQLDQAAKRWLTDQQAPGYQRAISKIPRAMFALKVGFHGTVALGTHAPMLAFQPKWWNAYIRDFGQMYKMVNPYKGKGATYYEMTMQDLVRRPNFARANRAGLVNDPFQYEDFNNPQVSQYFGNITGMGNRGYSVLKVLRQDMFDQMWNQLPKTAQIPEMAEKLANGINHVTGVTRTPPPKGANLIGFAPRLLSSRAAWLAADPAKAVGTFIDWKNADIADKQFAVNQAKEKAWVVGTMMTLLAINQGFLLATGSKEKVNVTDPTRSDFLKFKVAGTDISYGNPMISMARMPARLFVAIKNEGKLNKLIPEDERVANIGFDFARSQLSPVAGTVTDLGIGRDFEERPLPRAAFGLLPGKTTIPKSLRNQGITSPYTWKEYAGRTLAPIPFEEAQREVWKNGFGMTEEQAKQAAKVVVALGTGARLSEDTAK